MNVQLLKLYEAKLKLFEGQGYQHIATCLLRAFCSECKPGYYCSGEPLPPPRRDEAAAPRVPFFIGKCEDNPQVLFLNEFEIALWTCYCS